MFMGTLIPLIIFDKRCDNLLQHHGRSSIFLMELKVILKNLATNI